MCGSLVVVWFGHVCLPLVLPAQGGIYVFQLMDHYTAVVSLMFLAFFEVVAVCWIFGKIALFGQTQTPPKSAFAGYLFN